MKQRAKKSNLNEVTEKNLLKRLAGIKKKEEKEEKKRKEDLEKAVKAAKRKPKTGKKTTRKNKTENKPIKQGGRKAANALTPEEILQRKAERKERKKNVVNHLMGKRNRKNDNKEREQKLMQEQRERQIVKPDLFKSSKAFGRFFISPEICIDFIKKHILKTEQPICKYCNEETKVYQLKKRPVYKCNECKRQFRLTQGTIFHHSKVPLDTWFHLLINELISSKKLTIAEVVDHTETSKTTSYKMINKLRASAFSQYGMHFKQNCTVAIDTTAFFGKNVNRHDYKKFTKKETYKLSNQTLVIKEENGISKGIVIDDLKAPTILKAIRENVPMGATIYTDEHKSFNQLTAMGFNHETVNHSKGEHGRGNVSNNGAESFNSILKIAAIAHRNRISKKHLQEFINSVSFSTNVHAARLTLCEKFFLAIENIIYNRKPKKQMAALRMVYRQAEILHSIVQMVNDAKKETA